MRKLACRLRAQASVILFYKWPQRLGLVPELAKLEDAVGRMIRISNQSSLSANAPIDTMIEDKNSVLRLLDLTPVDTANKD